MGFFWYCVKIRYILYVSLWYCVKEDIYYMLVLDTVWAHANNLHLRKLVGWVSLLNIIVTHTFNCGSMSKQMLWRGCTCACLEMALLRPSERSEIVPTV